MKYAYFATRAHRPNEENGRWARVHLAGHRHNEENRRRAHFNVTRAHIPNELGGLIVNFKLHSVNFSNEICLFCNQGP